MVMAVPLQLAQLESARRALDRSRRVMGSTVHHATDNRHRPRHHRRSEPLPDGLSVAGSNVEDMNQLGVRWTTDQVLALAPDAASRKAGSKLGGPGPWSGTGSSAGAGNSDEGAVWGLCKGSG